LTQLHLTKPNLYGKEFRAVLVQMSGLRELTLESFEFGDCYGNPPVSSDDYAATFSALAGLEVLHVRDCRHVELLLPHLPLATNLRQLTIQLPMFRVPSRSVLLELLMAAPQLRCTLMLFNSPVDKATWDAVNTIQAVVGERFVVQRIART
jgi:hypothetical protein